MCVTSISCVSFIRKVLKMASITESLEVKSRSKIPDLFRGLEIKPNDDAIIG
jgi:hypothetical protein